MECRLHDEMDLTTPEIFIEEIVASYCDEGAVTEGTVDLAKVRPMLFDMSRRQRLEASIAVRQGLERGQEESGPGF